MQSYFILLNAKRERGASMWIDGIIAIILLVTIVQGFRRGFVQTFVHALGWLLAVVLGFVWYPQMVDFLKNKTAFYTAVHDKISDRITANAETAVETAMKGIPDVIRDFLQKAVDTATDALAGTMADSLSNLIFNIIGFLLVAFLIKILLLFITVVFSKEKSFGIIGGVDGFFGLLAGAAKGILMVYILLALMVPIISITGSSLLVNLLGDSHIGSYMYENNLIFTFIRKFW